MRAARACLAAVALGIACPALAAPPDGSPPPPPAATPADREAARNLAKRGYELFEEGAFKDAIDSFRKAEERFHAPPHWLYIARSQAALKRLLAAKQTYGWILDEKLPDSAPGPFKDAQSSARREFDEMEIRIPALYVAIDAADLSQAQVTVNGSPLALADLGKAMPMDPGVYTVIAQAPGIVPIERTATLKDGGGVVRVDFTLDTPPRPPSILPPVVAFTIGGIALAAGGITLGLSFVDRGPKNAQNNQNLTIASVASFIGGGVGVAAGVFLVVTRPKRAPLPSASKGPRLRASIGPASIGISGEF